MATAEIAKTMKLAREKCGYSQAFVADKLGVTYQAISNWEHGKNKIDSAVLGKLCNLYGLQVDIVLKVNEWHWSRLEDMQNARSNSERMQILQECGPCPEYIYEYQELIKKAAAPKDDGLSPHEHEIALAYRAASDDDRAVVDAALKKYITLQGENSTELAM